VQNYKIAMDYLKTIIGIVVGGLVIWSRIAESRAKQRQRSATDNRQQPIAPDTDWSELPSDYEPLSHNHFQPIVADTSDLVSEEGQRVTADIPPVPEKDTSIEPISDDSEANDRWRRAIIDSEILKTKF